MVGDDHGKRRIRFDPKLASDGVSIITTSLRPSTYHGCKADKLNDDKTAHCIEDTTGFSKAIVEELSNWLSKCGGKNLRRVAHAEA